MMFRGSHTLQLLEVSPKHWELQTKGLTVAHKGPMLEEEAVAWARAWVSSFSDVRFELIKGANDAQ